MIAATKTRQFFEATLSTIQDYVYSFDDEGRFLYANKKLLDLWGLGESEVIGKTMADLNYPEEVEAKLLEAIKEVFATGKTVRNETYYTDPKGNSAYYENVLSPVLHEDGTVLFVTGSSRDVSERKRTEKLLRDTLERTRLAMEATRMVTWEWDVKADHITTSESFAPVYGLPKLAGAAEGFALVLGEDKAPHLAKVRRVSEEGGGYQSQFRITKADTGETVWLEERGQALVNEAGRVERLVGVTLDITERKQTGAKLRELEDRNRAILESIDEAFFALDHDWKFTYVNRQAERLLGREPGDLLGKVLWHEYPGLEGSAFQQAYRKTADEKGVTSVTAYYPDHERWYETNVYPSPEGITIYFRNVTEQVQREEALHESQEKLKLANLRFQVAEEAAKGFSYEWDLRTDKVLRSEGIVKVLGYAREELEPSWEAWDDLIHPEDRKFTKAEALAFLQTSKDSFGGDYRVRHKKGHYCWLSERAMVLRDETSKPQRVVGQTVDITERKEAEAALRVSEMRYQTLFRAIDEGFCLFEVLFDENGRPYDYRFLETNPAFETHTGLKDAIGKTAKELVPGLEQHWVDIYGQIALTGESLRFTQDSEVMGRYFDVYAMRVGDHESRRVALVFKDITQSKRDEAKLRESEKRFHNMADYAPVMVWVTESDGSCTYLSQSWYEFTGQTPETGLGFGWLDATHPDDREESERIFLEANAKREGFRLEYRLRHKDGSYRWAIDSALPRFSEDGEFLGYIGSVLDISERKRMELALRDQLELTSTIMNNATQAIFMMDARGFCTFMNPAAEAMLGFSLEEIKAKPLHDMIHHHYPDGRPYPMQDCPIDRALPENFDIREHEDVFIRKNGEFFSVLVAASPIFKEGKPVSTVIEVRDITERKRFEDALREANEELSKLNEQQKRFVADAAHELRAPLTSIQGNLQLLNQYKPVDPNLQAEMLGDVQRESERLGRLVNDLLAIARGDSGLQLELKPVALEQCLLEVFRTASTLTQQHQLHLGAVPRVEVSGNYDRLKQLTLILLENAIKYTPSGGRITMGLENHEGKVRLCVSDNGIGISKEDLPHVFERFYRADKARTPGRDTSGTGLGLSIAEWIVKQHEGKIWLESELTKGTTAWVELPLKGS